MKIHLDTQLIQSIQDNEPRVVSQWLDILGTQVESIVEILVQQLRGLR